MDLDAISTHNAKGYISYLKHVFHRELASITHVNEDLGFHSLGGSAWLPAQPRSGTRIFQPISNRNS